MKLKSIFLVFTLLFSFSAFSQSCGSKLPANYASLRSQYLQLAAMSSTLLPHDTCLNKKLSIVFPKHKISVAQMTQEILRRFDVQDISIFDANIERIVAKIYDEGKVRA